ncbi:MAG: asparagine synthase-related protein [Bacteroidales bacterium]|nr:asparagine synthase-related protein [Bacteroidales bacterium]
MMEDKNFCLSSYMAYRYLYKDGVDFFSGMRHFTLKATPLESRQPVGSADEIDAALRRQMDEYYSQFGKIGILLSGGMDSAILASYLKPGTHAYTFVSPGAAVFDQDMERASEYCEKYGLVRHIVPIGFDDYKAFTPLAMRQRCAPVHTIEPQIVKAAMMAKRDGVEMMIIGDAADYVFGGMDKLMAKDWGYDEFVKRYYAVDPEEVLATPVDVSEPFRPFRLPDGKIDFMGFLEGLFPEESYNSYYNAFAVAEMPYRDPYETMTMRDKLDLGRIRGGDTKYLVRELYRMRFPERDVPEKIPMPRPVDAIFKDWMGPRRTEFRKDIDMNRLTGNQKWMLWCAELFLDIYDPQEMPQEKGKGC